jgi:putative phosphoribosyl transferase
VRDHVDEVVCAASPRPFDAVGAFYRSFPQTTDEEVRALIDEAARRARATPRPLRTIVELAIPNDAGTCVARLFLPSAARGVVVFAHGSGSGRDSPRNRFVATRLFDAGYATLLADLLTPDEVALDEVTAHLRFDIALLASRVEALIGWARMSPLADLPLGLFGASTGAAAAIVAAARHPDAVRAIVARGGRPDLAGSAITHVRAPTLLIVGARDEAVLRLNRRAFDELRAEKALRVVPDATHLFEEPGALDQVAQHAREWFDRHVAAAAHVLVPAPS